MKLLQKLLFILSITFFLSSCGDINEEMWINKDGSGKLEYHVDIGEALPMLMMMGQGAAEQQLENAPNPEEAKATMDGLMSKLETGIDTTMNVFEMMPDSVKREMDNAEDYKKVNIFVDVDNDESKALLKLQINFDDFKQIDNLISGLSSALGSGRPELENLNLGEMTGGSMSFDDNNYFTKKEFKQRSFNQGGDEGMGAMMDSDEVGQMMDMMFSESSYIKTYHFPYDVKSINGVDATVDGKTITVKKDFLKMMKEGQVTEMQVMFKKKFLGIF